MDIIIIYRFLTNADFFNINKPSGTEEKGGGQSYIDIPITSVSISQWQTFFQNVLGVSLEEKPLSDFMQQNWIVPVYSDGFSNKIQSVKIYRRRRASISIASQKITSRDHNRIYAWIPQFGFPFPQDPLDREQRPESLCVVLYRLENSIHAGWVLAKTGEGSDFSGHPEIKNTIMTLFSDMDSSEYDSGKAGIIKISAAEKAYEFLSEKEKEYNIKVTNLQLNEDTLSEDDLNKLRKSGFSPIPKERTTLYRQRNTEIVRQLKKLYNGKCQVTGIAHTFLKTDGQYYSEAHHLIPLGKGGSDSAYNIVILSPVIHRMLHSFKVKVDFSKFANNKLPIEVDGKIITIVYKSEHGEIVEEALKDTSKRIRYGTS